VQQDGGEEENGAGDREHIGRRIAGGGVEHVAVEAREPEDDQEEDDEPRVVHRDPDATDAKQRDAAAGHAPDVREVRVAFPHGHRGPSGDLESPERRLDA
jgi:hypothetical protein